MTDVDFAQHKNFLFDDSADSLLDKSFDDARANTTDEDAEEEQTLLDDLHQPLARSLLA